MLPRRTSPRFPPLQIAPVPSESVQPSDGAVARIHSLTAVSIHQGHGILVMLSSLNLGCLLVFWGGRYRERQFADRVSERLHLHLGVDLMAALSGVAPEVH